MFNGGFWRGQPRRQTQIPALDLVIAATAAHYGLTIATRDTGDYWCTQVALFNPRVDPIPAGADGAELS